MSGTLVREVRQFIEKKGLIAPRDSVLVAVSGGADSTALLYILFDLHKDMGFGLEAAHLNHQIRGKEADEDADFVQNACRQLGVRCHVKRADVPSFAKSAKLSTEEAARELRHDFLREKAEAGGHNKIALGHTMNDQAETVLMHLIRGAGISGASGMSAISDARGRFLSLARRSGAEGRRASGPFFIRPLLGTTRAEVNEFLASKQIAYREDGSNIDAAFTRNKVRHELVEILKEKYNPRIVEALCSHAALVAEADDYLGKVAADAYRNCVREETDEHIQLELASLLSYHTCVQSYILREAYRRLCGNLKDLGSVHVSSLMGLVSYGRSGDSVDITSGTSAWLDGRSLRMGRTSTLRSGRADQPNFAVRFEPGSSVSLPELGLEINSSVLSGSAPDHDVRQERLAFFDLEKLAPPFVLRNLEPGDRIAPFGMDGTKKVQDLLVDMKVPRATRKTLAVLCDQNHILWVVGVRRGNVAPITETTRSVLRVEVKCN